MEGFEPELRDSIELHAKRYARVHLSSDKTKLFALRNSFRKALSRLARSETKESAMRELQRCIDENSSPEALHIFLNALTEQNKAIGASERQAQIVLLGFIAAIFKQEMIDCTDRQGSLLKTVIKVVQTIYKHLGEQSKSIHQACASSLMAVLDNCLPEADKDTLNVICYAPLEGLAEGGANNFAQAGASLCLRELFAHLQRKGLVSLLSYFAPKFFSLYIVTLTANW